MPNNNVFENLFEMYVSFKFSRENLKAFLDSEEDAPGLSIRLPCELFPIAPRHFCFIDNYVVATEQFVILKVKSNFESIQIFIILKINP